MNTMNDLKNSVEQILAQGHIRASCGEIGIEAYRLTGGGVLFDLNFGGWKDKPAIRMMEGTPGKFTIAVAPRDGESIDCTNTKVFTMTESLDTLYQAFPYEHIHHIVDVLLAH